MVAHAVLTHGGIDGLFSFYQKRIDALRALRRAPKKPFPGTFLPVARIARNGATRELYVYGVLTRVVDITYDATKSLQDDADKINAAAAATAQDDEAPNTLIIRAKGVDLAGLEKTLRASSVSPRCASRSRRRRFCVHGRLRHSTRF